jgi:hypothetical protein
MKPPAAIINPKEILNRHLREAVKPHAAALRQAAALDRELEKEMNATHPDAAKKEANELLERASTGDKKAEEILRSAGGTEAFVKSKCAMFDLARAKHEGAAKASAPLWAKVSAAVLLPSTPPTARSTNNGSTFASNSENPAPRHCGKRIVAT